AWWCSSPPGRWTARRAGSAAPPGAACWCFPPSCPAGGRCWRSPAAMATSPPGPGRPPRWPPREARGGERRGASAARARRARGPVAAHAARGAAAGAGPDGLGAGGAEPWLRIIMPLGGTLLMTVAALLAFWPRRDRIGRPYFALLALVVLYVVPAIALIFTAEFLRGALLTLLVVAFLRVDKLKVR